MQTLAKRINEHRDSGRTQAETDQRQEKILKIIDKDRKDI